MSPEEQAIKAQAELARRALARRRLLDFVQFDFADFETNWHHRVIAEKLEAVERGDIKRLMLFLPPRSGKSTLSSIYFPAWYLGRHPERDVILASYSADLAVDFGRKVRNIVNSKRYNLLFATTLSEDNKSAGRWSTKEEGEFVAAGIGGGITGRGGSLILIDDPTKNREEAESPTLRKRTVDWFKSTVYTRLAPGGAIVLTLTRWHDEDLAGTLLAESNEWEVVSFPAIAERDEEYRKKGEAIWPSRYNLERLEETRRLIGSREFASLYQQTPVDNVSQEFKREMFRYRTPEEVSAMTTRNYLTVDTAISQSATSDYTGLIRNYVDRENKWNVKANRMKISPRELIDLLFTWYGEDHYDKIGIEKTVYYDAIKPFLDEEMRLRNKFLPVVPLEHHQRAKEVRIRGLLPRYESGSIYHIKGECADLEDELVRFPKAVHDDLSDSLGYQLQLAEPMAERRPSVPQYKAYTRNRFA